MEEGLANPHWPVTTRMAPSFPLKYLPKYNYEIQNKHHIVKETISPLPSIETC